MKKFITDWVKVGQSGPTVDGRNIDASWLTDAAETYSLDTYTAVLWVDHFRFYGNFGKVVELKTERDGAVVSLFARLQPNEFLLEYNKQGQKLYTSMELQPNFADTGKCYLVGLAVTDQPASLGTHELMFSSRKQHPEDLIVCGVELGPLTAEQDEPPPRWFDKAMARLGLNLPRHAPDAGTPGATPTEDSMDEKQFKEILDGIAARNERFDALEAKVAALSAAPAAPAAEPEPPAADSPAAPTDMQALQTQLKQMGDGLKQMGDEIAQRFADLTQRFERPAPGTPVPETTDPAGHAGLV